MKKPPPRSSGPHRSIPTPPSSGSAQRGAASTPGQRGNGTPPRGSEVERALALRDVMQHAVKVQQETTDVRYVDRPRRRRWIALAVCIPLLALSAYSWFARPEFIWGPRADSAPAVRREANLRLAMFLLSRRLIAYRATQGHYPATLADVGERNSAIRYRLLGDTAFELRSGDSANAIVLQSTDNPTTFLGNTANVINAAK